MNKNGKYETRDEPLALGEWEVLASGGLYGA